MKRSVLFVCMGNICRSPAGEGVFRELVRRRGLEDAISVASAGTTGYHEGELPDARMRGAAATRGYTLDSLARPFQPEDFDRFDLIVAMDRRNVADLLDHDPEGRHHAKVRLLGEFLPDHPPPDVPDPYHGGPAGFDRVLDMLETASEPLLRHLTGGGD